MEVACGGSVPDGHGEPRKQYERAEQVLDDRARHPATITTSCGEIVIELFSSESPVTANNFAFLAGEGFYDATIIHRVVPGFVVQMGDPTGTGTGGPGYRFPDELAAARNRRYPRSTVAMANSGPDTNGSQFFLISGPSGVRLPPQYALFGKVVSGLDVVDAMQKVETDSQDRPVEDLMIETVTIDERD